MPITKTLFDYLKDTQRFLRDANQDLFDPGDLIDYVNRGRREVAMRTQCIRRLTPISAPVITASVVAAGSAYTNTPTITITDPDFPGGAGANPGGAQATASAFVQGGTIAAVDITYGGDGYFQPTASITDSTGSGASVTLQVGPINTLNANQEQYPFSDIDLSMFPGVDSVFMIKSLSVIYSNYRYSLAVYSFSVYQARVRNYPFQYTYVPAIASQYGQGLDGSFFVFPLPSQEYAFELDCFCLPSDLTSNFSDEALPMPWAQAVSYYAAHLAFLELQNYNAAKFYMDMFDQKTNAYGRYARPGRVSNPYGRW